MYHTIVTMKDGSGFTAMINEFNPKEGYVTFMGDRKRYYFRDIERANTPGAQTTNFTEINETNELRRAKTEGWNGQ